MWFTNPWNEKRSQEYENNMLIIFRIMIFFFVKLFHLESNSLLICKRNNKNKKYDSWGHELYHQSQIQKWLLQRLNDKQMILDNKREFLMINILYLWQERFWNSFCILDTTIIISFNLEISLDLNLICLQLRSSS